MTAPLDPAVLFTSGTDTLTYDAASQISAAGYAYDSRGRLANSPDSANTWDDASRLIGIDGVSLTYNGLGDLFTRTEGGTSIHYYYNYAVGLTPIAAEKNETTGQFLRYYVWTPSGRLLYMTYGSDGNKVYFYHFDRVGSTLALTDAAGTVTDSYAYTPYGRLLGHNGTNEQPLTFVGQWGVREEGDNGEFYQMRARYYDALAASFVSRDPAWPVLGNPQNLNPYQYATENPLRYIDPQGTEDWDQAPPGYSPPPSLPLDADREALAKARELEYGRGKRQKQRQSQATAPRGLFYMYRQGTWEQRFEFETSLRPSPADIQAARRGLFYYDRPPPQTQAFVGNREAPHKPPEPPAQHTLQRVKSPDDLADIFFSGFADAFWQAYYTAFIDRMLSSLFLAAHPGQ